MDSNDTPSYSVLNPCGTAEIKPSIPLAPRMANITDKVVYCISQFVGGADNFVGKVARLLPQQVPGIKTVYKRKPSSYMSDDPELWDEIVKEANAVIYGCGA